jgi:hypothetical protein
LWAASGRTKKLAFCLPACLREIRKCAKYPRDSKRFDRIKFGLWLSLVERLVRDQEAVGSNPTSPIYYSASASCVTPLLLRSVLKSGGLRVWIDVCRTQTFYGLSEKKTKGEDFQAQTS